MVIGNLSNFNTSNLIYISHLKNRMGVTYGALSKLIIILKDEGYIKLSLVDHSSNEPEKELSVTITKTGLEKIKNLSMKGISFE